jgi:hypothetical protein
MERNLGTVDRAIRIAIGIALFALAVTLEGPAAWIVGLVGLVPFLTGIAGSCPVYRMLGFDTRGRLARQ